MDMKKFVFLSVLAAICLTSCGPTKKMIPRAVNTINTASLEVLNLERNDYEILNTITAEASIIYRQQANSYEIESPDDGFSVKYTAGKMGWICKFSGIFRAGYLSGDAPFVSAELSPEEVARGLAIYRVINMAKQEGADAVIAPTVATNVEQTGRKDIMYKTTVTAKLVKLKTNN